MGMFVGIVAVLLLLTCLLFVGGGCSTKTSPTPPSPIVCVDKMQSLDRAAVRSMLKRLANAPPPTQLATGAMCYSVAVPPDRADYICPKCGERTLYDNSKYKTDKPYEMDITETVERELPWCRSESQELRKVAGHAIELDETQFCRKCSPKVTKPKLVLHISYKDGKVRDVEAINHSDLRILHEFLSGKLKGKGDNEGEAPLKSDLPRLQELLGVNLEGE
jgi:hypothetical protein